MICPKCRSEIGNQPTCPYCGQTDIVRRNAGRNQTTVPIERQVPVRSREGNRVDRQLNGLELRTNLCLTLAAGTFVLQIITLLILVLK